MPQQRLTVFSALRERADALSTDEFRQLAQAKRLIERIYGDEAFLQLIRSNPDAARKEARTWGVVDLDPSDASSIWDRDGLLPIESKEMGDSPVALMWRKWTDAHSDLIDLHRESGDPAGHQPRFAAWRNRQIARCDAVIGVHAQNFSHPIFAIELSSGCSVGCDFCGLAAKSLTRVFKRTQENAALWKETLSAMTDMLGSAFATAICYWATEPMDNPDYLELINDFREATGELPQTTTSVPLRNIAKTRDLLALYAEHRGIQNRFSILSTEMLRDVHAAFTPEELFHVKLLLYCQPKLLKTTNAGRQFTDGEHTESWDGGTIACVSGFLASMTERTLKMIAPCPASNRWPLGYLVHMEDSFNTPEDFAAIVRRAIEEKMPENYPSDEKLAFIDDVDITPTENGIEVKGKRNIMFKGQPALKKIGALIRNGDYTTGELISKLIDEGDSYFEAIGNIQQFFESGLLKDRTVLPGTISNGERK